MIFCYNWKKLKEAEILLEESKKEYKKCVTEYKGKIDQYKQKMTQLMANSTAIGSQSGVVDNNNKSSVTLSTQQHQQNQS